jgi:catechol 2,3-dioxygenase-like lactoylglutathione lyase family enzyme
MRADSITRRQALLSLPALSAASSLLAQPSKQPIRVRSLSHMTLTVSDRKRSVEFYQGLFGLPVQHRQGVSMGLRIGSGPQYISLSQDGPDAKPGIAHFCMTVDQFSVDRVTGELATNGVTKGE